MATIPDEQARKVAEDVATYGHGYFRIDAQGRATHVPSYLVLEPVFVYGGDMGTALPYALNIRLVPAPDLLGFEDGHPDEDGTMRLRQSRASSN